MLEDVGGAVWDGDGLGRAEMKNKVAGAMLLWMVLLLFCGNGKF